MFAEPDTNWFQTAILNSVDGFFDWSIPSDRLSLSTSFKNFLGYTRSELNSIDGSFIKNSTHPEDQQFVDETLTTFFQSLKEDLSFEFRIRSKSNEYMWIRLHGKAKRDDLGTCHKLVGVITNIHSYKSDISHTQKLSEAKSTFIASLNHELRSPLSSIIGAANILLEDGPSEKQKKFLINIVSSADMLLQLVNDILDVSKIAAGKLSIEKRQVHLSDILDQVHAIIQPQYSGKNLTFSIHHDPSTPTYVMGDSTRIKQVLINLCTNAIKFTNSGGITIKTKYTPVTSSSGKFYLEVKDTGIGIAEDKIDILFQDFTQADITTNRKYGGTGLGLSICRKIIDLMGGDISVKSEEGKGSTFWFEIPVEIPREDIPVKVEKKASLPNQNSDVMDESQHQKYQVPENQNLLSTPLCSTPNVQFNSHSKDREMNHTVSLNILVAEDNMVNQAVMQGILETLGHKVTIAEDGLEAVTAHGAGHFDAILMDINMPHMNGIEACLKIRETDKETPIIAVTANTLEEEKQKCLAAGMNDFASKPVSKEKVMLLLQGIQKKSSATAQTASPTQSPVASTETIASAPPPTEIIYVNTESLKQFIADLGVERIKKFVDMYKNDAPKLIQKLQSNIEVEAASHTLAGMSENLNFTALGKSSRTILTLSRNQGDTQTLSTKINELPKIYNETIKVVENLLSQL